MGNPGATNAEPRPCPAPRVRGGTTRDDRPGPSVGEEAARAAFPEALGVGQGERLEPARPEARQRRGPSRPRPAGEPGNRHVALGAQTPSQTQLPRDREGLWERQSGGKGGEGSRDRREAGRAHEWSSRKWRAGKRRNGRACRPMAGELGWACGQ